MPRKLHHLLATAMCVSISCYLTNSPCIHRWVSWLEQKANGIPRVHRLLIKVTSDVGAVSEDWDPRRPGTKVLCWHWQ